LEQGSVLSSDQRGVDGPGGGEGREIESEAEEGAKEAGGRGDNLDRGSAHSAQSLTIQNRNINAEQGRLPGGQVQFQQNPATGQTRPRGRPAREGMRSLDPDSFGSGSSHRHKDINSTNGIFPFLVQVLIVLCLS